MIELPVLLALLVVPLALYDAAQPQENSSISNSNPIYQLLNSNFDYTRYIRK